MCLCSVGVQNSTERVWWGCGCRKLDHACCRSRTTAQDLMSPTADYHSKGLDVNLLSISSFCFSFYYIPEYFEITIHSDTG